MNVLLELVDAVGEGDQPEWTLLGLWSLRKWEMLKTLKRLEWDVERVTTLAGVLGLDVAQHPQLTGLQETAVEVRALLLRLDRFLTGTVAVPEILRSREIAVRVCAVWLVLEEMIRPEERGVLADLRDRLVQQADREEVDLRGLGI